MKTLYLFTTILLSNLLNVQSQSIALQQKLVQSDASGADNYGNSIDITGDLMIVGDPTDFNELDGTSTTFSSGAAYIYRRDANQVWNFEQKLIFPNRPRQVYYGHEVEIDGDFAFVSAIFGDFSTAEERLLDPGNLLIYKYNQQTGVWDLLQNLVPTERETNAYFGLDFSYQNGTLIVGESWRSIFDESTQTPVSAAGMVYIYTFNSNTEIFELVETITAPDPTAVAAFGYSVDFDNDKLIIGAAREKHNVDGQTINEAGSSYYFQKNSSGQFEYIQKIIPSNNAAGDWYGLTTTIAGDLMAVSAPFKKITNASGTWFKQGLVYLYKYDSSSNEWVETEQITTTSLGGNMWYGHDMDMEGNQLVISSYKDHFPGPGGFLNPAGAYWYHELSSDGIAMNSAQISAIDQNPDGFSSEFGYSCAISGNTLIAGAPDNEYDLNENFTGVESGAVFIYSKDQTAGITESSRGSISLFPNPATSRLLIKTDAAEFSFSIYDTTGKQILKASNHDRNKPIQIENLASGLYFIEIEVPGSKEVIKFMKRS